jgi:uncharacterized membrane protein YgaE (UPF0421/DUF939 family)
MTIAKAVAMAVAAAVTALITALDDGEIIPSELLTTGIAILGSAGVVWYVTNGPGSEYAKAVVGAITAALTSLVVALGDNVITQQEWLIAIGAAIAASGLVALVPNQPDTP